MDAWKDSLIGSERIPVKGRIILTGATIVFSVCFWLAFVLAMKTYQPGYGISVAIFAPVLFVGVLLIALITRKMESTNGG